MTARNKVTQNTEHSFYCMFRNLLVTSSSSVKFPMQSSGGCDGLAPRIVQTLLLSSFHFSGHTLGFHPQTHKVEPTCAA